jgi:predicted Rossmann fold nucleotide-binding protein DprA/Smf involved in DNA uptake
VSPAEFHHGQCVGADAEAHAIALELGVPSIIVHPADDADLRARLSATPSTSSVAYLEPTESLRRNKAIARGVDTLIAAPATAAEQVRSGTWFTIRYARRLGRVEVIVLPPSR